MYRLSLITVLFLSSLLGEEYSLDPISVEETLLLPTVQTQEEALNHHAFTLHERLEKNISFDTVDGGKSEKGLSYRGIDPRATGYREDGIPLYRTVNGFVDSTYHTLGGTLSLNDGTAPSGMGVSSVGADVDITTRPPAKSFESALLASWTTDERRFGAYVGGRIGQGYLQLNASAYDTGGYALSDDYPPTALQSGGKRLNSDRTQRDASLKGGVYLGNHTHIAAKIAQSRAEYGIAHNTDPLDPRWDAFSRISQKELESLYLYGDYAQGPLAMSFRGYRDRYTDVWDIYTDSSYTSLMFPSSVYDDTRTGGNAKLAWHSDTHTNALVFETERYEHHWLDDDSRHRMESLNIGYTGDYLLSETLRLEGALNYRQLNPKEGYETKKSLDGQLKFTRTLGTGNVFLSAAHKSRFPSMNEVFTFFPWDNPNPGLRPEKSRNLEGGVDYPLSPKSEVGVSAYYYDIKDLIIYENNTFLNRENAKHYGAEIRFGTEWRENHRFETNYRYAYTKDDAGERIELIPSHRFILKETITLSPGMNASVEYGYVGKRDSRYNDRIYRLEPYGTLDLYLSYLQKRGMSYRFGIKNLLDEAYEWKYGYPAQGRSAFATLEWKL